jgi:hypothetical protein
MIARTEAGHLWVLKKSGWQPVPSEVETESKQKQYKRARLIKYKNNVKGT